MNQEKANAHTELLLFLATELMAQYSDEEVKKAFAERINAVQALYEPPAGPAPDEPKKTEQEKAET